MEATKGGVADFVFQELTHIGYSYMDIILDNPIALLFLSFAIGAILHCILSNQVWYQQYYKLNFISDKTTKAIGVLLLEWLILKTPLRMFNQ